MNMLAKIRITVLMMMLFTVIGCDIGEVVDGHPDPATLIGKWESSNGVEHLEFHDEFETIDKNGLREYILTVTGSGKKIFISDDCIHPPEYPPYFEDISGKLELYDMTKQRRFKITWEDPVNTWRFFGIIKYKKGLSLYMSDPEMSDYGELHRKEE